MSAPDVQALIEKWKCLPPQRRAQVEDFVDCLLSRKTEQPLARAAAQTSQPAFTAGRDNSDDAEYDRS
jgi:hypothetical protein